MNDPGPDEKLRRLLERDGLHTSARHDESVLAAARAMIAGQSQAREATAPPADASRRDGGRDNDSRRNDSDAARRNDLAGASPHADTSGPSPTWARANTNGSRPTRPLVARLLIPLALAASFAAGMLVTRVVLEPPADISSSTPALVLPLDATRGGAGRAIPVEQANPDDWYHYIQELIAAGETREAERHLRRFNELHPDYAYQP